MFVVLGRRILGEKPGGFHRDTSVVSISVVHERNKATLLSLSEQEREYQRVPYADLPRDTKCPAIGDFNTGI